MTCAPGADVRGRHGQGLDLEEQDPLRPVEPREHGVEPAPIDSRACRDPEPRELEDARGLLPGEERGELVGADEEHGIVEPEFALLP